VQEPAWNETELKRLYGKLKPLETKTMAVRNRRREPTGSARR
jgi:hypothetical protein